MSRFKNFYPQMVYLTSKQRASLKIFSRKERIPVSQVVREGLDMRMSKSGYSAGYNAAIRDAMNAAKKSSGGSMRFPSGKSFGELVSEDIAILLRSEDEPQVESSNQDGKSEGISEKPEQMGSVPD